MGKNILELTGMQSTKYGGIEKYFVELVRHCKEDTFHFVYDTNLRLTMGNNSKTLSKNFSLDESISRMAAIYHM